MWYVLKRETNKWRFRKNKKGGLIWISNIDFHNSKIIVNMVKMTRYVYPGSPLTKLVQSTRQSDFAFSSRLYQIIKLITISKTTPSMTSQIFWLNLVLQELQLKDYPSMTSQGFWLNLVSWGITTQRPHINDFSRIMTKLSPLRNC